MADIRLTDLTNESDSEDGTGVFDILMSAVNRHIDKQFDKGRIHGTDYANVYLGSVQAVLQQSMQFLLNEQQSGHQADLIENQAANAAAKTVAENALAEVELEKKWGYDVTRDTDDNLVLGASSGSGYIDGQITETQEKVDLLQSQDLEVIAGTTRADNESVAKVSLMGAQELDQEYITNNIRPEELIKVQEEIDVLQSQDLELIADTLRKNATAEAQIEKEWGYTVTRDGADNITLGDSTGTGEKDEQIELLKQQTDLASGQTAKAYAEIALISQKQESELAQTTDPTGGILLAQKNLYEAQINGFEGKHKNELIKHMLDSWAVVYSVTEGVIPDVMGHPGFLQGTNENITDKLPTLDTLVTESDALFD